MLTALVVVFNLAFDIYKMFLQIFDLLKYLLLLGGEDFKPLSAGVLAGIGMGDVGQEPLLFVVSQSMCGNTGDLRHLLYGIRRDMFSLSASPCR